MSMHARNPIQDGRMALDPPRTLLRVEDLSVHFKLRQGWDFRRTVVRAVDGVSLSVKRGETLGVVGESGSGKTTLGRAILRRVNPASGEIWFQDIDVTTLRGEELRSMRKHFQCIFQDPFGSLNPKRRVLTAVAEPLVAHGAVGNAEQARHRVAELLEQVGMSADAMDRYPGSFSGGQLQRISIARALAVQPALIVADEPVSALDVSIQAQVTNLLQDLQEETGVAYLFISHDIAVVRRVASSVAVMYAGQVVEYGGAEQALTDPIHPYTQALIAAVPNAQATGQPTAPLEGEPADPSNSPTGCRFRTRCPIAVARCAEVAPPLEEKQRGQFAACWRR
jgi:peptide/nickel transport system ATP-binding protein